MYIFNKNIQKEIYRCFEQPTVANKFSISTQLIVGNSVH